MRRGAWRDARGLVDATAGEALAPVAREIASTATAPSTLRARVEATSVGFETVAGAPLFRWRTARAGDASDRRALGEVAGSAPTNNGARTSILHDAATATFTEWYEPRGLGVEFGYTVAAAFGARADTLASELAFLDGAAGARIDRFGRTATVVERSGRAIAHATELSARDARGRALRALFEAREGGLRIVVDARGATYPIEIDPLVTGATAVQTLTPPSTSAGGDFGGALAANAFDLVVGAENEGSDDLAGTSFRTAGAAYAFARAPGGAWGSPQRLVAPTFTDGAHFATAVAVDGDTLFASAPSEADPSGVGDAGGADVATIRRGAVYVFGRDLASARWSMRQRLQPASLVDGEAFGTSLAVVGDVTIVGCHDGLAHRGAVFVFDRTGGTWTEEAKTLEEFGYAGIDAGTPDFGGQFGDSVAFGGFRAYVGAPYMAVSGRVAVYVRNGANDWTLESELPPPSGYTGFGSHVAGAGDLVVASAAALVDGSSGVSAAIVYARDPSSGVWAVRDILKAADAEADY